MTQKSHSWEYICKNSNSKTRLHSYVHSSSIHNSQDTSVCVLSHLSHIELCATLGTVARQAPLSMGFSRQKYWSGMT